MAEEFEPVLVNVEPYQYEPIATESDGQTSKNSENDGYDVDEDRIGQVDW